MATEGAHHKKHQVKGGVLVGIEQEGGLVSGHKKAESGLKSKELSALGRGMFRMLFLRHEMESERLCFLSAFRFKLTGINAGTKCCRQEKGV